jgi:hypothetical protein
MSEEIPDAKKQRKLLISTPVFDGNIRAAYFTSFIASLRYLIAEGWEFTVFTEARGYVSQARNRAAEYAIKHGFDKLLFIDADIAWEPDQPIRLLRSNKKVVGGTYPFKAFPISLNVVPVLGTGHFDLKEYCEKLCDELGEVEVYRIPTGFLMIDVSIFKIIEPFVQTYHHRDPLLNLREEERNFFPDMIGEDGALHSEDWGFCALVQKAGEKCYFNVNCVVDHIGIHRYSAVTPINEGYKNARDHDSQKGMTDNPFSKWPPNYPCFCGTGKKFKACCKDTMQIQVSGRDALVLKTDYEKQLVHVKTEMDKGIWYKMKKPIFSTKEKIEEQIDGI